MKRAPHLILSALLTFHVYLRSLWLTPTETSVNPGVAWVAAPLALLAFVWVYRRPDQQRLAMRRGSGETQNETQSETQSETQNEPQSETQNETQSGAQQRAQLMFAISLITLSIGLLCSARAAEGLALTANVASLRLSVIGVLLEVVSVVGLWSAWTWRQTSHGAISERRASQLHFPLSIALFAAPWEGLLRGLDESLQRLSTDIAVLALDMIDVLKLHRVEVRYWDLSTIYSDQFYLIVNETCAGVNLILSMSLYALGFGWVMGASLARAWTLVAYIIPLSIFFNGLRVAVIFMLGHAGSVELATGAWHEGSGYVAQGVLFVILGVINARLTPAAQDRASAIVRRA